MGAKHAKWFIRSTETTGWLRETELVPKTQGVVSSVKQMKFAMGLVKHNKAGLAFPPHVARDVNEARNLRKLVHEQDRSGALGHVQGERALARLAHGHTGEESLEEIYSRQGAFARPYLPGEGSAEGQGSLTQADVTPGKEPTKKPGGGA
jgi:hypothetical protein